jgi:hypothetical protein
MGKPPERPLERAPDARIDDCRVQANQEKMEEKNEEKHKLLDRIISAA